MKIKIINFFVSTIYISIAAIIFLSSCSVRDKFNDTQTSNHFFSNDLFNKNELKTELEKLPYDFSAHWLSANIIVLPKSPDQFHYQLLNISNDTVNFTDLSPVTLPKNLAIKFPHLAKFQAYQVLLTQAQSKQWLKQKLMVLGVDSEQKVKKVAYVQAGGVIDALYTQNYNDADEVSDLGATIVYGKNHVKKVNFKLWAPTAHKVEVLFFNDDLTQVNSSEKNAMNKTAQLTLIEDSNTGVWEAIGDSSLIGTYYQYKITLYHPATKKIETLITTDPYSLSLSTNSKFSQVVDLNDESTKPPHWENHQIPVVKNIEDNVIYETHIRDFSSDEKALSNIAYRGKYKAFSEENSNGINHLKALGAAGLNNIHLLPVFDIATVYENSNNGIRKTVNLEDTIEQVKAKVCPIKPKISICNKNFYTENNITHNESATLKALLESFDVSSAKAQEIVSELREFDNFNWGYDPYHYTVPEGSYAVNPQGISRLVEFREMVQSIHNLGFRVIMDVVYNHTHQSGLEPNSVLDKIVPNYYHRLDPITGEIEQSTCCDNTATERVMMEKLMIDSLVVWARDYKIDGFRFDLMGHQPKLAMLKAREAVRLVDNDTYFYGEGWNFGEVANNKQFVQASQLELHGSEIGTYSDRLRDAVRGGSNNTRDSQGIGNGLLLKPNELQNKIKNREEYNLRMNQLRIGLAGNLAEFPLHFSTKSFEDHTQYKSQMEDNVVLGKNIPYGDQPTGYALDPADTVNYVSKHDNQTLWDNSQYRLAFNVSTDDRVRMHLQSLAFVLFAQGIPFLQMGSEFMRSKSFLRDSYDYSDWFNRVDFSKQSNYYNIGLPPAEKDKDNWPLINTVLKGHQRRDIVNSEHIQLSAKLFKELLAIRMSSPLFRLTTSQSIIEKISFLNSNNKQLGLLVMKIDDTKGQPVDNKVNSLMVIFNTSFQMQFFNYTGANAYQLHPIQKKGSDKLAQSAYINSEEFAIPALSSLVFVSYK